MLGHGAAAVAYASGCGYTARMDACNIIEKLALAPHPEGGYYRRTYECGQMLTPRGMPRGFEQPRPVSTAILFLLRAGQYSRLHRIRQDELWHFHLGGPLRLAWIDQGGRAREVILGSDIFNGHALQFAVPGGHWFGATPAPGSGFSLVGCTVAPGFDFTDLHLARRHELERRFPLALDCIREFCPPDAPPDTVTDALVLDLPQHARRDESGHEDEPLRHCKGRA